MLFLVRLLGRVGLFRLCSLIIASGGRAGLHFGSTGDGYGFARSFGHSLNPPRPALVACESDDPRLSGLRGRARAQVTLMEDGRDMIVAAQILPDEEYIRENISENMTEEEMFDMLKLQYDGYHFGEESPDVFNPYSLMNAFKMKKVDYYWFGSGTPTFLFESMKRFDTNILELEQLQVPSTQFDVPTEGMTSALPLLYQAGYLTIKGYDFDGDLYTLDFPNAEVKVGFMENFLARMMNLGNSNSRGFAGIFYVSLLRHDIEAAMKAMQSFFASIPYLDVGAKELDDIARYEAYYEVLTYVVFSMINCRTFTQVKVARGRTDLVVFMRDAVYVMELKMHGTAQEALDQINSKDYAIPYEAEGKPVIKIGIAFSQETKTLSDWKIER